MIAYLVVEGPDDAHLLRSILPAESASEIEIVPGGGLANAKSTARTLLVTRRKPLALVFDANATVPEVIRERYQSADEIVGMVAGRVPFRVIMAVPNMADVFSPIPEGDRSVRRSSFLDELNDFLRLAREYETRSTAPVG